jgi:predicted peroxiredoxin
MAKYLLIESRDPFESNDVPHWTELAKGLAKRGNEVTLFLLQNGVLGARRCARSAALEEAASSGVQVLADDFSLRERGIPADRLTRGVKPAPLDVVIEQLSAGCKALWH